MAGAQAQVDRLNADFWDELCGTTLAAHLGITDDSAESLTRFDRHYLGLYPYLDRHLPRVGDGGGDRLLEMGLGYGTVSQVLASRGFDYNGLDIAAGPVAMVRHRLRLLGVDGPEQRVRVGSALDIPHPGENFDQVVTLGCLHHTGDLAGAVREVQRVLRPGGRALVMIYKNSLRRRSEAALRSLRHRGDSEEEMRGAYDRNLDGEVAPATEYSSVREARKLFSDFSEVSVRRENYDEFLSPVLPRRRMLGLPARLVGLDLYITATK